MLLQSSYMAMTGQTYPSCQSLGSGEAADQYYVPVNKTWRLNERMYGGLTGREWRMVSRIRYGGDKTCQNGQFLSCQFCFSRSWLGIKEQNYAMPISADAARVGQEGDSRRPKIVDATKLHSKYAAPHRHSSAPKVKKHGADQVCVLSLPRWNGEDLYVAIVDSQVHRFSEGQLFCHLLIHVDSFCRQKQS